MIEVPIPPRDPRSLRAIAGRAGAERYTELLDNAKRALRGGTVWHINSTARGGGVAELLGSCLGYLPPDGIDARWLVIEGDPEFFRITKRIHNHLHGLPGSADGAPLGRAERARYDHVIHENVAALSGRISTGDVVVVHDPQPLGMVPSLRRLGATVVWTCHVGVDEPNDLVRSAWAFLAPDARAADAVTFTRREYEWDVIEPDRIRVIPPCIDATSPKNLPLETGQRAAILAAAGLIPAGRVGRPTFTKADGTRGLIEHVADVTEDEPVPPDAPLVVQVSRWDGLKDPLGVMRGFVREPTLEAAHLILAGPAAASVADDPEAAAVLLEVGRHRAALADPDRRRVHLASIPVEDVDENAAVVNALQRRADVVVQKSLAEGFGLTVTEAMWKARPVVAGEVGGIRDQIDDGLNGLLVDPTDLWAFGKAIRMVLENKALAWALGRSAERTVRERYLAHHYLGAYLRLFADLRPNTGS